MLATSVMRITNLLKKNLNKILLVLFVFMSGFDVGSPSCTYLPANQTDGVIAGPSGYELACWKFKRHSSYKEHGLFVNIVNINFASDSVNFFFKGLESYLYRNDLKKTLPKCVFWTFNDTCEIASKTLANFCPNSALLVKAKDYVELHMATPKHLLESWNIGNLSVEIRYQFINCSVEELNRATTDGIATDQTQIFGGVNQVCNSKAKCSLIPVLVLAVALVLAIICLLFALYKLRQKSKHAPREQTATLQLAGNDHASIQDSSVQGQSFPADVYSIVNKTSGNEPKSDNQSNDALVTDVYAVVNKDIQTGNGSAAP